MGEINKSIIAYSSELTAEEKYYLTESGGFCNGIVIPTDSVELKQKIIEGGNNTRNKYIEASGKICEKESEEQTKRIKNKLDDEYNRDKDKEDRECKIVEQKEMTKRENIKSKKEAVKDIINNNNISFDEKMEMLDRIDKMFRDEKGDEE